MNKNLKELLLLFVLVIVTPVCIFAAVYSYDAAVTIGTPTVVISHTQPEQVPPINHEMVLVGTVTFSDTASISGLSFVYALQGVSAATDTVSNIVALSEKSYKFTHGISFDQTSGNISYQFLVSGNVGSVSVSTVTAVYVTTVTAASSKTVDPTSPEPVILESGDQTAGNTSITFVNGSFTGIQNITITQLDHTNPPVLTGALKSSETDAFVALYLITPEGLEISPKATLTLYFGDANPSKLFMKYREASGVWTTITDNVVIDASMKTISARISKLGYYAVSTLGEIPDNDYRPEKRVVIMGRDTFKFPNMNDGDRLKIFNVNGRKVREITSRNGSYTEGFEWDGKQGNGNWADSGTYIYQLKIQGKGKLINGTIAFVK